MDFSKQLTHESQLYLPPLTKLIARNCKIYPEYVPNSTNNSKSVFLQYDRDYVNKLREVTEKHLDELFCTEQTKYKALNVRDQDK